MKKSATLQVERCAPSSALDQEQVKQRHLQVDVVHLPESYRGDPQAPHGTQTVPWLPSPCKPAKWATDSSPGREPWDAGRLNHKPQRGDRVAGVGRKARPEGEILAPLS